MTCNHDNYDKSIQVTLNEEQRQLQERHSEEGDVYAVDKEESNAYKLSVQYENASCVLIHFV